MRWLLFVAFVALVGCASEPAAPKPEPDLNPDATAKRVQEALARLDDDNPNTLHADYTPAVWELIDIGEPAIEPTLPYLLSENWETRLHADRVISGAMARMYGFIHGRGWSRPDGERKFRRFYLRNPYG